MKRMAWMFALLVAVGCTPPINSVERAHPEGQPHPVADKRIITDSAISSIAQIIGVNESTVSGDLAKIQVTVFNSTSSAGTFNYKFEWYDADGMLVDSPMSIWKQQS